MSNAGPHSDARTGAVPVANEKRRRPLWLWLLLALIALLLLAWLLYALLKDDGAKTDSVKSAPTTSAGPGVSAAPSASESGPSVSSSPAGPVPTSGAGAAPNAYGAALVGGGGLTPRPAVGVEAAAASAASAAGTSTNPGTTDSTTAARAPQGTVLFASDSAALDTSAQSVIAAAATRIKVLKPSAVTVTGYTDVVGGQPTNTNLSQQRAEAVAAQLRKDLGDSPIVTAIAKGESEPVASNATRDGRQQNRRASITTN